MDSAVVSFHYPNGLQRLVLLCWLLVHFQLGFAESQVKWIPAKGNNGESGGRPHLPYSQRKLDEHRGSCEKKEAIIKMGIKEEDLPDHYFPDDHPTRGTGNASSTGWTKANQKKAFFIVMAVVAVYIWHRRRYGHHQYDYIGNGMRFGGNGETGSIGNRFGSFTQHVASESEEKKLEAARDARLRCFAGCDVSSPNVIPEEEVLRLRKRSAALRSSVNIAERNQQLGDNGPRIMRVDDL